MPVSLRNLKAKFKYESRAAIGGRVRATERHDYQRTSNVRCRRSSACPSGISACRRSPSCVASACNSKRSLRRDEFRASPSRALAPAEPAVGNRIVKSVGNIPTTWTVRSVNAE
jgi:hypothetical protein